MAMQLKIARSAKELDDVFWLRHEVYVVEDGKYAGESFPGQRIVDRFDAFLNCVNIIAYDQREPVGTLRISLDGGIGLPCEEYFDLSGCRSEAARAFDQQQGRSPLETCAGMLAVRKQWKSRRDVIRALIKMAVGVWHSWGVTHVYATVNHDTVGMYDRLGFSALADRQWIESIGNYIIPIAAPFESLFQWAFGYLRDDLLEAYSSHFERLLLKPGEVLFTEGDEGGYAYVVDEGAVKVSRQDPGGAELTLATLERGEIFGELALIDTGPRSATATAMKSSELIMLDRETFQHGLSSEPRLMNLVMGDFAKRIRRMDDLAMVLAYGANSQRLSYAIETLRNQAKPDAKQPDVRVVRMGPEDLAHLAGVSKEHTLSFLESRRTEGVLDYKPRAIHFYAEAGQ
mgnify:CR=1 FL=1